MRINLKQMEAKEYKKLLHIIVSGCKFKYISYDHKKAVEEYSQTVKDENALSIFKEYGVSCYDIPTEIKEKYKVERVGKLRRILFLPNGLVDRVYIGNKYSKPFQMEDFYVKVTPILK